MKNNANKTLALILAAAFLMTCTFQAGAQAAGLPSEKEEVVYVNLDGDGNLTGTYVVNSFTDKDITDYGDYSQVKNMNTRDEISLNGGEITVSNSADKLYYEGVIDNAQIPWNIKTTYQLGGTEYSAKDIAGKSGSLTLKLSITENNKANKVFFDNYALQVTVKLDTDICKNIVSEGATQANAGRYKQLTYTVMPGNEKDIVITSDVTDFEMESIAVNGIRLELGIDRTFVDTGDLSNRIGELQSAVAELDTGAKGLDTGAGSLNDGALKLNNGINAINDALKKLNGSSPELTSGSGEIKKALSQIQTSLQKVSMSTDELTKLSQASVQIKDGIDSLVKGLQTMDSSVDAYYNALSGAGLTDVNAFISKHRDAISALGVTDTQRALYSVYVTGGTAALQTKLGELVKGGDAEAAALYKKASAGDSQSLTDYITSAGKLILLENLLKGDISYIQGSEQLIRGINDTLDSKDGELMTGALKLQSSYTEFNTGISALITSLNGLVFKMTLLKNGIDTLVTSYNTLDSGIADYTDAVKDITDGYGQICDGALSLVSGTSELYDGTKTMVSGTGEFVKETSGLQDEVDTRIDAVLNEFSGSDFTPVSFVSDKNTNVDSVQFVIKLAAVKKAEVVQAVQTEKEHLNLWQKFLRLFGLY